MRKEGIKMNASGARPAGLAGATLEAVIGWEYPAFYGWAAAIPDDLDYDKLAEHALDAALDEVFGRDRPAGLRTRVVCRHPICCSAR
jgi:hypothetical protein